MGADFLFATCEWPKVRNGELAVNSGPLVGAIMSRLAKVIATTESLADFGYYGNWDEETDDWRNEAVESCREVVDDIFGVDLKWGRNDVATFDPEWNTHDKSRRMWVMTGGMSWGDVPTDAFDTLCILDALGIMNEPFEIDNPVQDEPGAPTGS